MVLGVRLYSLPARRMSAFSSNSHVRELALEYKSELLSIYGSDLAQLLLFGSYARGEIHQESDIDFAVIFRDPARKTTHELVSTSAIGSRLSLKYGIPVSTFTATQYRLQHSLQGIFQEMRKEGIEI